MYEDYRMNESVHVPPTFIANGMSGAIVRLSPFESEQAQSSSTQKKGPSG
jgi:hypothetical protein